MATFNEMVNEVKTNLQGYTLKQDRLTYLNAAINSVATSMVVGSSSNLAKGPIEIDDELIWIDNFSTASDCAVICGKIGIATQLQREQEILLAQFDKFREQAINNTLANSNRAAPATPSSVERMHCLLHCSAMKQVDVSLRASTMSPILEMQSTIPKLTTTVKGVASPEIPPTVE